MKTENSFVGYINLLAIPGAEIKNIDSVDCIVLPLNQNPTIEVSRRKDGNYSARLNMYINDANGKFGNAHYIKMAATKRILERLSTNYQDIKKYCPIIGNTRSLADEKKVNSEPRLNSNNYPQTSFSY